MTTTLITGGAGFIGSTLARRLLDQEERVVLADVKPLGAEARFVLGDAAAEIPVERVAVDSWSKVAEAIATHRPRRIVHIAALTNPVVLEHDPLAALRVNVEGTVNVLEASRLFDVERVILFSSIGALASVSYEPIDGDHPVIRTREGPGSGFYGASKVAGEAFGLAYAAHMGVDVRIVRPSAVYGFGMAWPIYIKPMVEGAVRGEPVRFESGGGFPRDYTHVADVATLTVALLGAPDDVDRIFYAATGEPLVTAAQAAAHVREIVPGADIEIADGLSSEDELEIRYRGRLSIANACEQLGYRPRFAALRDGLAEYVDRYRAFLA